MRAAPLWMYAVFCLLLLIGPQLRAQNCGCAEAGACPQMVAENSSETICYAFTDAFNNDLSDPSQGICGFRLRFTHNGITNLAVTLTSPAGQSVQLVGAASTDDSFTSLSLFDLTYVPCAPDGTPAPDIINGCAMPDSWTNTPPCPAFPNGLFNGSYFPFSGCLQDFDTGPVNGDWCITFDNTDAIINTGELLDFEVILCDNTGIFCCDADAGALTELDDLRACESADTLLLDPMPQWTVRPDTTLYGYVYTVAEGDNILAVDSTVDLRTFAPGTYTVCGVSYARNEANLLPAPGSSLAALQADLQSLNPSYCAQITDDCRTIVIGAPPPPTDLSNTICIGDSVSVGDQTFRSSGNFSVVLADQNNCDSLVNLDLTVLLADTVNLTVAICAGDSFAVGDSSYTITGNYENLLVGAAGCDSLVRLDLTVVNALFTDLIETICAGDGFAVGDSTYTLPGNYSNLLQSASGCDSTVTLDLTVISPVAAIAPPDTLTCTRTLVTLDGSGSTAAQTYTWTTSDGSIVGGSNSPTIDADAPGTYQLRVANGTCSDSTVVVVQEIVTLPTVSIAMPDTLNCFTTTLTLNATASSAGSRYAYQWATSDGCLTPGTTTSAQPGVTCGGTYTLVIRDTATGCVDSAAVTIAEQIDPPTASIDGATQLNCTTPTLQLDGSASTGAGSLSYEWSTVSGPAISGAAALSPIINGPGTFRLVVIDNANFCRDSQLVSVTLDDDLPLSTILSPDSLTCLTDEVTLDGSGSSSGGYTYLWTPTPTSGQGTPVATADAPGAYVLSVTNDTTGCAAIDSVRVFDIREDPIADAGAATFALNCTINSVSVGGVGTSTGGEFEYRWRNAADDLVGTGLFYTAVDTGWYYLTVSNTLSNCTALDSVLVDGDYRTPSADAGSPVELNCGTPTTLLDGGGSDGPAPLDYAWYRSDGTLLSNTDTVTVGGADTYALVVTQLISTCPDTSYVTITQDDDLPVAEAGPGQLLDCLTGTAQLDGTGSSQGSQYTYTWTPTSAIFDNTLPQQPIVDSTGTFTLVVLDTENDCSATDQVTVSLDPACAPTVDAGADGVVNCYSDCDTLDATATFVGPFTTFEWSAISGQLKANSTTLTPVVSEGVFELAVTNTQLNETIRDTVAVLPDYMPPFIFAGNDTLLGCTDLEGCYTLDAQSDLPTTDYAYAWVTAGGNFCSDTFLLNPTIDRPGLYELTITDLNNGCTATDVVIVSANPNFPDALAGPDQQIACGDSTVVLDGSGSSTGGAFSYFWQDNNGAILNGETTLTPEVQVAEGEVGTFYLTVTDNNTTCSSTDSVLVAGTGNCQPLCDVLPPHPITCDSSEVILNGSNSSSGPDFIYLWSTANGQLCPGPTNAPIAYACAPGTYELRVVDTANGVDCTTTVTVADLTTPPVADAPTLARFACSDYPALTISGAGSSVGNSVIYNWDGPCVVGGADSLNVRVGCDGNYTFTVTDTVSGCVAIGNTQVVFDTLGPVISAGLPTEIGCSNIVLSGNGPGNSGETVIWKTTDGVLIIDETTYTPTVGAPGTYLLCVTDGTNGCTSTDSILVSPAADALVCDAGPNRALTCIDTSFTVMATVSAGSNFVYEWTTPDGCIVGATDTTVVTVDCAGTYRFRVSDPAGGCECVSEFEVTDLRNFPLSDAGPDRQLSCDSSSVTLDGSGSSDGDVFYFWTTQNGGNITNANSAVASVAAEGTYRLVVTDQASMCSAADTVRVSLDATTPVADAGADQALTCTTVAVLLDGSASSQGDSIAYNWTTPDGDLDGPNDGPTAMASAVGTYILGVTNLNNGCATSDTVLVSLNEAFPVVAISATGAVIDCSAPTATLTASSDLPADSISYTWFLQEPGQLIPTGSDADTLQATAPGTYVVEATYSLTGCTDTAQFVLNADGEVPLVLIGEPDTLTCLRDTVLLEAEVLPTGNYSYQWLNESGNVIPGADTATLAATAGGSYTLITTNLANGCPVSSTMILPANLDPPQARAEVIGIIDCETPSVQLDGNSSTPNSLTYQWSSAAGDSLTNAQQAIATAYRPGDYTLLVTRTDNGCSAATTVTVEAREAPIFGVQLDLLSPTCFSDTDGRLRVDSVIGGTPPFVYSLNDAVFTPFPQFSDLSAATYALSVQDANGCTYEELVIVPATNELMVSLNPSVELLRGDSTEIRLQATVDAGAIDTIIWENAPCVGCTSFFTQPLETQRYTATVRDTAGCTASAVTFVYVLDDLPLFVPSAFSPNFDNENDIFLPFAGPGIERIAALRIFDRWGELVFVRTDFAPNNPNTGWDGTLDGRPLNPGVFIWQMEVILTGGDVEPVSGEVVLLR